MQTKHLSTFLAVLMIAITVLACGGQTDSGVAPQPTAPVSGEGEPSFATAAADLTSLDEPTPAFQSGTLAGSCDTAFTPESNQEIALTVQTGVAEVRDTGFVSVAGEIRNPTSAWVGGSKVWLRICNERGELLLADYVFANPSQIGPNGVAYFHILHSMDDLSGSGTVARFQVDASAVPGDDRGVRAELVNFTVVRDEGDNERLLVQGQFHNSGAVACLSPRVALVFTRASSVFEIYEISPEEISNIAPGDSSLVDNYWYIPQGADAQARAVAVCDPFAE